jgi:hypothetical protein
MYLYFEFLVVGGELKSPASEGSGICMLEIIEEAEETRLA